MAVLGIVTAFLLAAPAPAHSECEHWQGEWRIVQMEITVGTRTARLKFAEKDDASWRVKDGMLTIFGLMAPSSNANLRFDAKNEPKKITLTFVDGTKIGPTVDGTFVRDGNSIEVEFLKWPREGETVKLKLSLRRAKE